MPVAGHRTYSACRRSITGLACLAALLVLAPRAALAAVQVITGPTPIERGDAHAAGDITLVNERLAVAIAVESVVPYGVPRGAIIDVAPVREGRIGRDQAIFADFMPNNWSAWPNTYARVTIIERDPARAVVRAERDWGKVTITTLYTLEANSDHLEIVTTMQNQGDAALTDLLSGLTLWARGGYFFGIPGLAGQEKGKVVGALADRVVGYDEDWVIALHSASFDHINYGARDLYLRHSLQPGESRSFTGWLQVEPSGDLAPVIKAEIARRQLPAGRLRGVVTGRDGARIERPVIVIEKQGQPYGWVLGRNGSYELALPAGDYALYATAKNSSQTAKVAVTVAAGASAVRDFRDLDGPGKIAFNVSRASDGRPLDARIAIVEGQKPLVQFLGKKVFFTELDRRGRVEVPIAAGRYRFQVASGGGFLGASRELALEVAPGGTQVATVALPIQFDPRRQGWYAADLHHHADQAEAVTPPADLARSQLAAGLDLLVVTDHDSTVNHRALQRIAQQRGMAFIPGVELSASWGHFNAYPLSLGGRLGVDTGKATVAELFEDARRLGAIVIQSNHPYLPEGYMTSLADGVAPGGFSAGFDLLEINARNPEHDEKVLTQLSRLWNGGHRYYLTAGSDTHDVWNEVSGAARTFAHLDGAPTAAGFARAMQQGHAYVSFGPLIFPSVMFGETLKLTPGAPFTLGFELKSVAGIRKVELVGDGAVVKTESFAGSAANEVHVDFPLTAGTARWYALRVENSEGRKAYSNPIWVDTLKSPFD